MINIRKTLYPVSLNYLIYGILSSTLISIIGNIYIGEIIGLILLVKNLNKLKLILTKELKYLIIFTIIFSLSQIISDIINSVEYYVSLKGVTAPILFTINIIVILLVFVRRTEYLKYYLLGCLIANMLTLLYNPNTYFSTDPWKWGIGMIVLQIILILELFLKYLKSKILIIIILMTIYFIISLVMGGRTLMLFGFIGLSMYLLFNGLINSKTLMRFPIVISGWRMFIIIVFLFTIFNYLGSILFSDGGLLNFSNEFSDKNTLQSSGNYGILIGGRVELISSFQAFIDKPLFGHGSWALDINGIYLDRIQYFNFENNYSNNFLEDSESQYIPVHSYLMGGFVWAGIMGGIFWIFVIRVVYDFFINNINRMPIYYCTNFVILIWDIIFSPFGYSHRFDSSLFIGALIIYSWSNKIR